MHYSEFVADYTAFFARDPNQRLSLGLSENLGHLPDPSLDALTQKVREARELQGRAQILMSETEGFDERLDLQLADLMLGRLIFNAEFTFNGKTTAAQLPEAGDGIGNGIFQLFISDPRPETERLQDILGRLDEVPRFLDQMLARLDSPVRRWVDVDVAQTSGLPSLFDTILERAKTLNWPSTPRLQAAIIRANEALSHYAAALKNMDSTEHFHIGDANARAVVKHRGIQLPLEDIHALACDFLRETNLTIEALRTRLCEKYELDVHTSAADLQHHLNQVYRLTLDDKGLDGILDRYQEERKKVLEFIRERDLFPVFEEQDMMILRTPGFLAPSIPAGAMVSPPPLREGVRRSLVYLTLSEELRDEHTDVSIPIMMVHEGIPGHHLQLAWASKNPSPIRRMVDAMEHAEGWTTMLEDYILDQGYGGDLTDEIRFIAKRDMCRLGARVAIDLYFMTGHDKYLEVGIEFDRGDEDPFSLAAGLLKTVTGFVDERVQAELNWYSSERGYPLSYLTGNHLVWDLKRDFETHQGGASIKNDRLFHHTFLTTGNMPVSFLRQVFVTRGLIAS